MKFKLHWNSDHFLVCDFCGNDDFRLLPGRQLTADKKSKHFLFYECLNCKGVGFWTHKKAVDEKREISLAIARCKTERQTGALDHKPQHLNG